MKTEGDSVLEEKYKVDTIVIIGMQRQCPA